MVEVQNKNLSTEIMNCGRKKLEGAPNLIDVKVFKKNCYFLYNLKLHTEFFFEIAEIKVQKSPYLFPSDLSHAYHRLYWLWYAFNIFQFQRPIA